MRCKYIILLLVLFSFSVMSKDDQIGYGRFYARNGDSIKLIKQQLLYSSTVDLINKTFVSLKLNKQLFWEKFNFKKNEYKEKKIELLTNKYQSRPSYLKDKIRLTSLRIDRQYGRLRQLLTKYSILKRSRSLGNKEVFLMKIRGVIDRNKISQLYNKYIYEFSDDKQVTIYLNLKINNIDFLWEELGTEKGIVEDTLFKNISEYLALSFNKKEVVVKKMSDVEYVKTNVKDGLYLALDYKIQKLNDNVDQGKTILNLEMSTLIIDNKLEKKIGSLSKELKNYTFYFFSEESKKKSLSNLVTSLYQFPLSEIIKSRNRFNETIPRNNLKILFNSEKLSSVFRVVTLLEKSLVANQVHITLTKINLKNIFANLNTIGSIRNIVFLIKKIMLRNVIFKDSKITFEQNLLIINL